MLKAIEIKTACMSYKLPNLELGIIRVLRLDKNCLYWGYFLQKNNWSILLKRDDGCSLSEK